MSCPQENFGYYVIDDTDSNSCLNKHIVLDIDNNGTIQNIEVNASGNTEVVVNFKQDLIDPSDISNKNLYVKNENGLILINNDIGVPSIDNSSIHVDTIFVKQDGIMNSEHKNLLLKTNTVNIGILRTINVDGRNEINKYSFFSLGDNIALTYPDDFLQLEISTPNLSGTGNLHGFTTNNSWGAEVQIDVSGGSVNDVHVIDGGNGYQNHIDINIDAPSNAPSKIDISEYFEIINGVVSPKTNTGVQSIVETQVIKSLNVKYDVNNGQRYNVEVVANSFTRKAKLGVIKIEDEDSTSQKFSIRVTDEGAGYDSDSLFQVFISSAYRKAVIDTVSLNGSGAIDSVSLFDEGFGYSAVPTVLITGDHSVSASGSANINGTSITIDINASGEGYVNPPSITYIKGESVSSNIFNSADYDNNREPKFKVNVQNGKVHSVDIVDSGSGIYNSPQLEIKDESNNSLNFIQKPEIYLRKRIMKPVIHKQFYRFILEQNTGNLINIGDEIFIGNLKEGDVSGPTCEGVYNPKLNTIIYSSTTTPIELNGVKYCIQEIIGDICPTYYEKSDAQCVCPSGTYGIYGFVDCTRCPDGKYVNKDNNIKIDATGLGEPCTDCDAGRYSKYSDKELYEIKLMNSNNNSNNCYDCLYGKYSNNLNSECINCDPGYYYNSTCTQCVAGRYFNAEGYTLTPTEHGTEYGTERGTDDCLPCPAGRYQTSTGAPYLSNCTLCSEGKYGVETASQSSDSGCIPCVPGRYSEIRGVSSASSCKPCPAGKYGETAGLIDILSCTPCGLDNMYQESEGQDSCSACPAGSYTSGNGTTTRTSCNACPSGSQCDGTSVVVACVAGKYLNRTTSECTNCVPGKWSLSNMDNENGDPCTACGAGMYISENNYCVICPEGFKCNPTMPFFRVVQTDEKEACEKGKFSEGNASVCTPCDAGKYQDELGQSSCKECPDGNFITWLSLTLTKSNCEPCPPGNICIDNSIDYNNSPCSPGKYTIDNLICLDCPAGQYQEYQGQGNCDDCPPEKYQDVPGASGCTSLLTSCSGAGQYIVNNRHLTLENLGEWKTGSTGKVEDYICINCPPGKYSNSSRTLDDGFECEECLPGTYSTGINSNCVSCSEGTTSTPTYSTTCVIENLPGHNVLERIIIDSEDGYIIQSNTDKISFLNEFHKDSFMSGLEIPLEGIYLKIESRTQYGYINTKEIVQVTHVSGNDIYIRRGQLKTTPIIHNSINSIEITVHNEQLKTVYLGYQVCGSCPDGTYKDKGTPCESSLRYFTQKNSLYNNGNRIATNRQFKWGTIKQYSACVDDGIVTSQSRLYKSENACTAQDGLKWDVNLGGEAACVDAITGDVTSQSRLFKSENECTTTYSFNIDNSKINNLIGATKIHSQIVNDNNWMSNYYRTTFPSYLVSKKVNMTLDSSGSNNILTLMNYPGLNENLYLCKVDYSGSISLDSNVSTAVQMNNLKTSINETLANDDIIELSEIRYLKTLENDILEIDEAFIQDDLIDTYLRISSEIVRIIEIIDDPENKIKYKITRAEKSSFISSHFEGERVIRFIKVKYNDSDDSFDHITYRNNTGINFSFINPRIKKIDISLLGKVDNEGKINVNDEDVQNMLILNSDLEYTADKVLYNLISTNTFLDNTSVEDETIQELLTNDKSNICIWKEIDDDYIQHMKDNTNNYVLSGNYSESEVKIQQLNILDILELQDIQNYGDSNEKRAIIYDSSLICVNSEIYSVYKKKCTPTCSSSEYIMNDICHYCLEGTQIETNDAITTGCTDCDAGKYSTFTSEVFGVLTVSKCKVCPDGKFSKSKSNSCTLCEEGKTANSEKTFCTACGVGKYQHYLTGLCNDCPAGKISSMDGIDCVFCEPGKYESDNTCTSCGENEYSKFGQSSCVINCPDGYVKSDKGCFKDGGHCAAGQFYNNSECNQCDGTVSVYGTEGECFDSCPEGTYIVNENETQCIRCSGLKYLIQDGDKNDCVETCPDENYANFLKVNIHEKQDTGITVVASSSNRDDNEIDIWKSENGIELFVGERLYYGSQKKIIGTILYTSKSKIGIELVEFTYNNDKYTFNISEEILVGDKLYVEQNSCTTCSDGEYLNTIGRCISCPVGKKKEPEDTECTHCLAGTYQNETGQTSCYGCPPGKYQNETGRDSCQTCDGGIIINNQCIICPPGTEWNSSNSECRDCLSGQYSNASTCIDCPSGKYSENEKQAECTFCDPGQITESIGSTSKEDCTIGCEAGKYKHNESCENCIPGKYQDEGNKIGCKICQSGKYSGRSSIGCIQAAGGNTVSDGCYLEYEYTGFVNILDINTPLEKSKSNISMDIANIPIKHGYSVETLTVVTTPIVAAASTSITPAVHCDLGGGYEGTLPEASHSITETLLNFNMTRKFSTNVENSNGEGLRVSATIIGNQDGYTISEISPLASDESVSGGKYYWQNDVIRLKEIIDDDSTITYNSTESWTTKEFNNDILPGINEKNRITVNSTNTYVVDIVGTPEFTTDCDNNGTFTYQENGNDIVRVNYKCTYNHKYRFDFECPYTTNYCDSTLTPYASTKVECQNSGGTWKENEMLNMYEHNP